MNIEGNIIGTIFIWYIFYRVINDFLDKCILKRNTEYILYITAVCISLLFLVFYSNTILIDGVLILLVVLFYNGNIVYKFALPIIAMILMLYNKVILIVIVNFISQVVNQAIGIESLYYIYMINLYIIVIIMERFIPNKKTVYIDKFYSIFLIIMSIIYTNVIIGLLNAHFIIECISRILIIMLILSLVIIDMIYINAKVKIYKEINEKNRVLKENDYIKQIQQYNINNYENIRKLNHDWKNHLGTIDLMIPENKEVHNYIEQLLEKIDYSRLYSKSGIVSLDAIVNYKCCEMKKMQVIPNIQIIIDGDNFVESIDWTILVGNILDNAIDAVRKMKNNRYIKLSVIQQEENVRIVCENTFDGKIEYSENRIITTKANKENHGIGLSQISCIVDKYNGVEKITNVNNLFKVEIIIFHT